MRSAKSIAVLFVVASVLFRFMPHPPNMAPIVGVGLFCGAYFSKRWAMLLTILAMAAGDLLLGLKGVNLFGWAALALIVLLGSWLKSRRRPGPIVVASLVSSIIFFVISNFGVWAIGGIYPMTFEGLGTCYVAGIPFFRNGLAGDLIYAAVLFGGYEALKPTYVTAPLLYNRK